MLDMNDFKAENLVEKRETQSLTSLKDDSDEESIILENTKQVLILHE